MLSHDDSTDFFFYPWNMAWGFAVWKSKMDALRPFLNRYPEYRRNQVLKRQNLAGGLYISDSLRRDYYNQKLFRDAILCTEMFNRGMRSILPTQSKILNIGLDGSGQSSGKVISKFDVNLDDGEKFDFCFSTESEKSLNYCHDISSIFNGKKSTQLLRAMGLYHQATEIRSKLTKFINFSN
jgi:hypothetical protein